MLKKILDITKVIALTTILSGLFISSAFAQTNNP